MPAFLSAPRPALATPPAEDQPLQHGRSLAWGAVTTLFAVRLTMRRHLVQMRFGLFAGEVARVDFPDEKGPLLWWVSFQGE